MDAILDVIHINTFWTILLIFHGLASVALLGALTHQAMAVLWPVRSGPADSFVRRFRAVSAKRYVAAVCVLWIIAFVLGGWIYAKYRIYVRIPLEQDGFFKTQGAFELKEHLVSFGLGALPLYWYLWTSDFGQAYASARKWLTAWLALVCWYAFLVGHIVNNVRGYGS